MPFPNNRSSRYDREEGVSQVNEFRKVENLMDCRKKHPPAYIEENEEQFPQGATRERLRGQNPSTKRQPRRPVALNRSKNDHTPEVMTSVEIRRSDDKDKDTPRKRAEALRDQFVSTDGKRRDAYSRESSDELQGEKTVPDSWESPSPLAAPPAFTPEYGTNNQRRIASPSNISPTDFARVAKSMPGKIPKRKPKGKESGAREFQLKSARSQRFRFDDTMDSNGAMLTVGGENLAIRPNPNSLKSDGRKHEFPIQHIWKIIWGTSPSRKIRLFQRRNPDTCNAQSIDLEFISGKACEDFRYFLSSNQNLRGHTIVQKEGYVRTEPNIYYLGLKLTIA